MDEPADDRSSRGRVLVTGASIAGPAAAYWLDRVGYDVTVLERSPEPRRGGQNIDVRGLAKEVLERMGLRGQVLAANTGEVGTRFVDADGATVSEFPADEGEGDGPTAELEVLRGRLAGILTDACGDGVTWWAGDHVVALAQDDDQVTVTLAGGDAPELRRLGLHTAWGTVPRTSDDDDWWRWMTVPGSRSVTLRPDDEGTTRVTLGFMDDADGFASLSRTEQVAELRRRFGDLGWEVPRVLDALEADDELYVEDLTQVRCPTWSSGRVVLLGDAAWCTTPIAGAGTSLALIGAHVLAVELSRSPVDDHPAPAYSRWEEWMRPLVEDAQDLPPGTPRLAHPSSRVGTALLRAGTRVAASGPVRSLAERLTSGPDPERELPEL